MTPEQEEHFTSVLALLVEQNDAQSRAIDELKGMLGNHALATATDVRALTQAVRDLTNQVLRHDSDIATLKGDTDPCPGDGPLPPNGSAE